MDMQYKGKCRDSSGSKYLSAKLSSKPNSCEDAMTTMSGAGDICFPLFKRDCKAPLLAPLPLSDGTKERRAEVTNCRDKMQNSKLYIDNKVGLIMMLEVACIWPSILYVQQLKVKSKRNVASSFDV